MKSAEDHQKLKYLSFLLVICDCIILICSVWLFWDSNGKGSLNIVYFVIIIIALFFYIFKLLYIIECWDEKKRHTYEWNRRMEWLPLFFMLLNIAINIIYIFFIFPL